MEDLYRILELIKELLVSYKEQLNGLERRITELEEWRREQTSNPKGVRDDERTVGAAVGRDYE